MHILYDHQIFTGQNYGGISRYFCELMTQFSKDPSIDISIALRNTQNENLLQHQQLNTFWSNRSNFLSRTQLFSLIKKMTQRDLLHYSLNNKILHINQNESVRLLKKQNFDIFHPTYFDPYFLKYLQQKPYVVTVYDMIHEIFPDYFSPNDPTKLWKNQLLENADGIIAISENTKTDIIKFYDIDPKKIELIPLATSLQKHNLDRPLKLPQKYILFVGNRKAYKNFAFFINSISSLLAEEKDLYLICTGGGVFSEYETQLINNFKIKRKVIYYPVTNDRILSHMYQNAILFAFPSLYEGFGIPILEAFSCGCPVAASNCSSIPEVGGDAVIYFDPNNSNSIEKAISDIVQDKGLQDSLKIRGFLRLKLFSWLKTAKHTKRLYEDIINDNPHN